MPPASAGELKNKGSSNEQNQTDIPVIAMPDLRPSASPHAGLEKIGVHNIVKENRNVVDVEIAFGVPGTDEDGPSARRIDFAAL